MGPAPITFDQLPQAVGVLMDKMDQIMQLLAGGGENVRAAIDDDAPMTLKQASEFLKISPKTIYNMTSAGKIPHAKPGRHLMFFKADLLAWVEEARCRTNSEIAADVDQHLSGLAS